MAQLRRILGSWRDAFQTLSPTLNCVLQPNLIATSLLLYSQKITSVTTFIHSLSYCGVGRSGRSRFVPDICRRTRPVIVRTFTLYNASRLKINTEMFWKEIWHVLNNSSPILKKGPWTYTHWLYGQKNLPLRWWWIQDKVLFQHLSTAYSKKKKNVQDRLCRPDKERERHLLVPDPEKTATGMNEIDAALQIVVSQVTEITNS